MSCLALLKIGPVAPNPLGRSAGGQNTDGQQRQHLAQADGAAQLKGSPDQFGVEPWRSPARRKGQLRLLDRAATQPQRVSKHSYRDQQEEDAKPQAGDQRIISLGQPNEGGDEEEDEGVMAADSRPSSPPIKRAELIPDFACSCSSRYRRQLPIAERPLTRP
jgi:hypothetical protein